jgi:rhodanese-related sulfurtransferase
MTKTLLEKLGVFFKRPKLPIITASSSLQEIAELYPNFYKFIQTRYGIKVSPEEKRETLTNFVSRRSLPPPQVVFMEVQMDNRSHGVSELSVQEVSDFLRKKSPLSILDVREQWELKMGKIPDSMPLTAELLDEIIQTWEKDKPILLYCHFGVRSLDAASYLADKGFEKVFILKGGIDCWSTEVDPTIPRYEGAYC